jgi:excisionase family DNA binding protein
MEPFGACYDGGVMVDLDGEQYLTGEEAASLLGIKRETLYAYVSRGYLKSYRQGIKRQRLYRRAEVEDLLRLSASSGERASVGVSPEDIPLAESWIRD